MGAIMKSGPWLLLLPLSLLLGPSAQGQERGASGDNIAQRGEYLARAGDCIACHTALEGRTFAGGRVMPTPFGTLYSSNITPDPETGVGRWSPDEFYRAMHNGRFPDGGLIYPAMPFASYTKVTRSDSDAIFAYLKTIPPVNQKNRPHDMRFPYNNRRLLLGWRTLYFTEGEYEPESGKSSEWNRGAYLVEGLGHCAMCHSPINRLGGTRESEEFKGGLIPMQNWYAPSLTSNRERARRMEHHGHHRSPENRYLGARRRVRPDGGGRLQQPAIPYGRRRTGHGCVPEGHRRVISSAAAFFEGSEQRGEPADQPWQDIIRRALRDVPWSVGRRQAAALAASRWQPVDRDGIGRQRDPDGAQWRLSACHR
jgi:mono/diheme cytochrome c family protein